MKARLIEMVYKSKCGSTLNGPYKIYQKYFLDSNPVFKSETKQKINLATKTI